ncbi:hypothetical protein A2U01_0080355, partial [Trifolium medium]|nr:hypothetical protein [Trifolium medium]
MVKPLRPEITPTVIAATTTTFAAAETGVAVDAAGAEAAVEVEAEHSIVKGSGHRTHISSSGLHHILIHSS